MKLIFTLIFFSFFVKAVFAQHKDCYTEWSKKFEERGAEVVGDGTYSDVIITFRKSGYSTCINGSATVKEGKVNGFYTEDENGQLIKVVREWESDLHNITVSNGKSSTIVAKEQEQIVLFWPKKLKPSLHEHKEAKTCGDDH